MVAGLDIEKLATLNAVQRAVVYDALGPDQLRRQQAEEQVRAVIRSRYGRSGARPKEEVRG